MPTPRAGESKDKFVSRCISYMSNEKPNMSKDQRVAVCFSLWKQHKKKEDSELKRMMKAFIENEGRKELISLVYKIFEVEK